VSVTYCVDTRCTTGQRCWREANERYGNAPGENYGPRCIPAPPSVEQTYEQGIAEGERRATAAEMERLRAEVSYLRACVPPTRPTDYGHEVWTAALRAVVAAERAAVVAWLREYEGHSSLASLFALMADTIERGEHRKEDK